MDQVWHPLEQPAALSKLTVSRSGGEGEGGIKSLSRLNGYEQDLDMFSAAAVSHLNQSKGAFASIQGSSCHRNADVHASCAKR